MIQHMPIGQHCIPKYLVDGQQVHLHWVLMMMIMMSFGQAKTRPAHPGDTVHKLQSPMSRCKCLVVEVTMMCYFGVWRLVA